MRAILYISEPKDEETGCKTGIKNHRLYLPDASLVVSEYAGYAHLKTDPDIELIRQVAESIQEVSIDFPDGEIFMDWAHAEKIGKETARRVIQDLLKNQETETGA